MFHLVLILRMNGAVYPLILYAFMAYTERTLPQPHILKVHFKVALLL